MPVLDNDGVQIAACELFFGGQRLDLLLARSATVDLAIGKPGMFTLDMEGEGLDWMDASMFAPGTEVGVRMGYQGNLQWLFTGEVMGLNLSFAASQTPRLTLRAYD